MNFLDGLRKQTKTIRQPSTFYYAAAFYVEKCIGYIVKTC